MDHVLCTELRNLGVHNVLITWIGSFLTNRSQSVKISSAISGHVVPRGGIPQGTKYAPLLFAVFVNNLARQWKIRAKYVDDLSGVEIIPRCSTSFLPFIARDICTYASEHGMRLNPVKCKEMFIDFLHYNSYTTSRTILLLCSFLGPKSSASTRISCLMCVLLIIYAGARTASTLFRERANVCTHCVV